MVIDENEIPEFSLSDEDVDAIMDDTDDNGIPEWEEQFDQDKLEKSKVTPDYPPTLRFTLNKVYNLKILLPPFNPEKEGKPLTHKKTLEDGKTIEVKTWALKVNVDDQIIKTYYPDQLTLYKLASFRRKNNLSHTSLIGKRIEIQKEQDGFYQGKPRFKFNTRFFLK